MIQTGQLAYFAIPSRAYVPLKASHNFSKIWDKVGMLWGDPVYVISIDQNTAMVSAKGRLSNTNSARRCCFGTPIRNQFGLTIIFRRTVTS